MTPFPMQKSTSHAEEGMQILQEKLEATEDAFREFIYTVSHDLGAPLRAIVNFSKLIREKHSAGWDDTGHRYMDFVTEGGEKMQALLNGLVQYSRLNTQAKPLVPLETAAIVEQCRAVLKDKIAAANGSLTIDGNFPIVMADPDQLFQLFLALLDNALTYRRKDMPPQIVLRVADNGHEWKFVIEDNGIGILPTDTERVFHLFRRLHSDDEYPGIGMGLTIAKKIIERHGGDIGLLPSRNGGTIAWFSLPQIEIA